MKPRISVIVASGAGGEFIFRCLDSLLPQVAAENAEIIVPDRCGGPTAERLKRDYPSVTVLEVHLDHRPSVPELRKSGVKKAGGDIVAVIEEHCLAPPNWLPAILGAFRDTDAAIGGPILDNNFDRIRDWVVYFAEYSNYLPPWSEGKRLNLNGANVAYAREKLLKYEDALDTGYWEVVLHPKLAREGDFRAVPPMGAYHSGPFDYGYYLGQRYLLSRVWGGTRREQIPLGKRLIYLVAAPVLPLALLARVGLRVVGSGRRVGKFCIAIPLLIPVFAAYVWGEWLGYLLGPGDALERVE